MLAGAVQRVKAECRTTNGSFASLQRVSMALAEHGNGVLHRFVQPAVNEAVCTDLCHDFWTLVNAVLRSAVAGKVGHR